MSPGQIKLSHICRELLTGGRTVARPGLRDQQQGKEDQGHHEVRLGMGAHQAESRTRASRPDEEASE